MANSSGDTFGGDATFNTSNGLIEVAYVDTTIFQGDVTINNSKVTFNNSSGFVMCIGSASQEFGGSADYKIGKLIMNKTVNGVTLQRAATIDSSLTLTNGIIYTDTINLVTLKAGSTCSGASILSYVDGPMQKIGNTSFIFPIGKNGSIRKFGISAPSLVTENVRLELKRETPPNNTSLDTGLIKVCPNEFFHVRRTTGSSPIKVTLSWGNSSEEIPLPSNLSVAGWNGSLWKIAVNH
ncbi:MAG: hypothetical protein IPJ26_15315 [Bacteroidetes bacterium]|nr:hypothetical protein [Bacteroidota bacterium]